MIGTVNNLSILAVLTFFLLPQGYSQDVFTIRQIDSTYMTKNPATQDYDQVFIGNVFLEEVQKKILFFCDSAYQHSDTQLIEAFGNVQINKADTVDIKGDYMSMDLLTNIVKVRGNAILENSKVKLLTDSMDYDLNTDIGYYKYGGKLVDSTATLSSRIGEYYTQTGDTFFKGNVLIEGKDYTITTDSMRYNTHTNKVHITAPTDFKSEDYDMYTEEGVYNTQTGISNFTKATRLKNKSYVLTGDTLDYDEKIKVGILTGNCQLVDTVNNMVVLSSYMKSDQKDSTVLATRDIELQYINESDTLFAHSDTIFVSKDTLGNSLLEVFHKVKFFKSDLQGKCDSMAFTGIDSIMHMFYEPTIWSEENQLTGDTITAEFVNEKLRFINLIENAFVISSEDSIMHYYNQLKGRRMRGIVENDTLKTIFVTGNSEAIYFAKDKKGLIGFNQIRSSDVTIRLDSQKIKDIVFITQPTGTFFPMKWVDKAPLYLNGFRWEMHNRPLRREDIFHWNVADEKLFETSRRNVITEEDEASEEGVEDKPQIIENVPKREKRNLPPPQRK